MSRTATPISSSPQLHIQSRGRPISTPFERVGLPMEWAEGSDRDYVIAGRRGRDYYRLADVWLRSEVEASRLASTDPQRATELREAAQKAKEDMRRFA